MTELFLTLEATPALLYLSYTVLGLLVGSFLNVVIHRVPKMLDLQWKMQSREILELEPVQEQSLTLSKPASTCPSCGHQIKPHENIPILSYLFLKGACSHCQTKISIRYPLVEAATALLSLAIAFKFGASYLSVCLLLFTWTLIALTMIDADTQLLPDNMTLPLLWGGLIVNYFGLITTLEHALWGAIAGYLALWLVFWGFKILTGKEGMGYGDFKLLAALGAWLGWQMLPVIILLSSVVGAVIGIAMIVIQGRDKATPMPFGPYLAIAGWIALMWGPELMSFWLGTRP